MHILVTGAAGFIGYHLTRRLLRDGHTVTGLDNINDYYDPELKYGRLQDLEISKKEILADRTGPLKAPYAFSSPKTKASSDVDVTPNQKPKEDVYPHKAGFCFFKQDLEDHEAMEALFSKARFDAVVHLAAQAGVRYSIEHPRTYIESNIKGFLNTLEACRHHPVRHLIYASSSSVYGANTKMPFSVHHNVDHPVSLYAATKKANELMAHTYSVLYGIPSTGLRFFTVYGPWGRPDMALFLFARAIMAGRPIDVYNHGKMQRDFTYVDDIVESITRLIPKPPVENSTWPGARPDPAGSFAPYQLFNIGNNRPVALMDFIEELEKHLGKKAEKKMMPIQPGDVPKTWADVNTLFEYIDYQPQIPVSEGIKRFVEWYKSYYV